MRDYHRVVHRCDSGEFISQVYEIPWCVASGITPAEALAHLEDALTWALANSQRVKSLRDGIPPPLSESEWGDVVGQRPEHAVFPESRRHPGRNYFGEGP